MYKRPAFRPRRRFPSLLPESLELRRLLSLTINPTFAANITSDPNAATIEATINRAIAAYESFISDNVTVNITFQEGGGLGGSSGGLNYFEKYQDYYNALNSHKTSATDTSAVASLPNQANDPINNQSTMNVRAPLARALGFNAPTSSGDGTITLNTSICNLDRTGPQDPSKYDLQAVTSHEIDEILGYGSSLDAAKNGDPVPTGRINPDDLFRYDQNGNRSYSTSSTDQAYFSVNGGSTDLARFNQSDGGDRGDWFSTAAHTPQIQDAFGTPGATPNLGVELTRLDAIGYNLNSLNAPVITAPSTQNAVERQSASINLGSFSDPDAAPWGVTVNWGDGSQPTTYFLNTAGSLGNQTHTYAEEGNYTVKVSVTDFTSQADTRTFDVAVSDPAVNATAGAALTPVEGQNTGNVTVATFTDPGGSEPLADYSASINWGDGTTTTGTISFNGSNYVVQGNHTYAEESAADHPGSDPYTITVTVKHDTAPDATVTSSATVSDPAVVATAVALTPVEGSSTGNVTVATFTDPAGPEPLADYAASISWGDGTTTTGTISGPDGSGVYSVIGSHTYAEESAADHTASNPYAVTVTISHESAPDAVANSTATVSDPAVSPTGGFTFVATEGQPSATQTLATFTDPAGPEISTDYTAMIDWGDGTAPSAGTITGPDVNGVYTVTASHTFASGLGTPADFGNTFCSSNPPSYHKPITVTVSHENAPTATATSDAQVTVAPGTAHLASDGSLIVVGTSASDSINIVPNGPSHTVVSVLLNSVNLGTFNVTNHIVVAAMGGNDNIQVAGGVRAPTVLYGGPGADRIKGGGGNNILVGCDGNDTLLPGTGSDLLIGGSGADRLVGGPGSDILVAGSILDSTSAETEKYADLVAILSAGRVNSPFSVADDGASDTLTGGAGADILYAHVTGLGVADVVTGLTPFDLLFNT